MSGLIVSSWKSIFTPAEASSKQADIAFLKLDDMRFSGSHDPLAALLLCGAHKAEHVMVAGKWRVRYGVISGLDIGPLILQHSASAQALVAKI